MNLLRGLFHVGVALAVALFGSAVFAQQFPSKPVQIVVPFPPGGTADILARVLGQKMSASLGQQIVVDNRSGAGGIIATEYVARAPADGYTLLMGYVGTHAINASLYSKLPYDPIKDFSPISLVATAPNVLVVYPGLPARSVKEIIALAKSEPGSIAFSSAGNGTAPHLAGVLFANMAGINLLHVPYKGAPQATQDLIAGLVQMQFPSIPVVRSFIESGRLRAIAVTGLKRSSALPNVPTVAESGVPGYEVVSWYGVLGPAGLPRGIVSKLHSEITKALQLPDVLRFFAAQGAEAAPSSPEQFAELIRSDITKWAQVVRASGARID
jgi:tripartite-type tricarboxylate transporter receptor subunit TctC